MNHIYLHGIYAKLKRQPLVKGVLNVSLSTIAATSTLSFMISFHLLKAKLVVMIVAFFPALNDRVELPLQTEKRKNTVRFTNADWSNDTLFRYDFFKNRYTYGREV